MKFVEINVKGEKSSQMYEASHASKRAKTSYSTQKHTRIYGPILFVFSFDMMTRHSLLSLTKYCTKNSITLENLSIGSYEKHEQKCRIYRKCSVDIWYIHKLFVQYIL